jgi:hypothetical protein
MHQDEIAAVRKWMREHEDYDFDRSSITHVPLKSLAGRLFISGMEGYARAIREAGKFDIVISITPVPTQDPGSSSFQHIQHPIRDEKDSVEKMDTILPILSQAIFHALKNGSKVLVHCTEGMSRSATVVLYYLMDHHSFGIAPEDKLLRAVQFLQKRRPCINPNDGFLQLLSQKSKALGHRSLSKTQKPVSVDKWPPW